MTIASSNVIQTKAIVAREPLELFKVRYSLEDVDVYPPGEGEILVEMRAVGICHTDNLLSSVPTGVYGVAYPKVAGHEGAGIVKALGQNVQSVKVGDKVLLSFYSCASCAQCNASHPAYCESFQRENYPGRPGSMKLRTGEDVWANFFGQSSFSHYSIVRETSVVNVESLLHDEKELQLFAPLGCGFQTGMGAIQNITHAQATDVVMVLGMGAVGMGALMTAKIQSCKAIVAVDLVESRLELAKELGATHTINMKDPKNSSLKDAVRSLFPDGVSIAIDTTGVPAVIEQSLECIIKLGKFVIIGVPAAPEYELSFHVVTHINTGRSITGCIEGDCIPQKAIPQMIQWYREGQFPIDRLVQYFDAKDFDKAFVSFKEGSVVKPVLVWN